MTHLTAATAITAARRLRLSPACRTVHRPATPHRPASACITANYLEKGGTSFHYSCVRWRGEDRPASEYGGRGSLNTTAPVFDRRTDVTGARAQRSDDNGFNPIGPVAFSNRRKKE